MMNDVVGSVRQVIQDFLAPELRQHRAELVAIRGELTTSIEAVESRLDSKIEVLKSEMSAGFIGLRAVLENAVLRGELSTAREIADLRFRVERLEKERGQMPQ
jgi:hypothetical protein